MSKLLPGNESRRNPTSAATSFYLRVLTSFLRIRYVFSPPSLFDNHLRLWTGDMILPSQIHQGPVVYIINVYMTATQIIMAQKFPYAKIYVTYTRHVKSSQLRTCSALRYMYALIVPILKKSITAPYLTSRLWQRRMSVSL